MKASGDEKFVDSLCGIRALYRNLRILCGNTNRGGYSSYGNKDDIATLLEEKFEEFQPKLINLSRQSLEEDFEKYKNIGNDARKRYNSRFKNKNGISRDTVRTIKILENFSIEQRREINENIRSLFGEKVTHKRLLEIAGEVSKKRGLTLSRMPKRSKEVLLKWFYYWDIIKDELTHQNPQPQEAQVPSTAEGANGNFEDCIFDFSEYDDVEFVLDDFDCALY